MTETAPAPTGLRDRLEEVRRKIKECALRCRRLPEEITLVAVSKTHPAELVRQAIAAGLADFGENRVQEAEPKIAEVERQGARWHLIGHLQSNKVRRAVALFDVIHSLDSIELAHKLDRYCAESGREKLPVLIQVDLGHKATKSGADESEVQSIAQAVVDSQHLRLTGLMTVPPFFSDPARARPFFQQLRELRDALASQNKFGDRAGELSMGMTNDYQVAIEEGATIVRIGTAIFGERKTTP